MTRELTNTELFCLAAMQARGFVGPAYIAAKRWPSSRQADKKAATIRRCCDRLVKAGYAMAAGPHHFGCTPAGKQASTSQIDRPPCLRLARH